MNKKTKKIVIASVTVLILAILAYAIFWSGAFDDIDSDVFSSFSVGQSLPEDNPNSDILNILKSVQNINLDDRVFSNPAFASFTEKSVQLPPAGDIGRVDIFMPLGVATSANSIPRSGTVSIPVDGLISGDEVVGETEGFVEDGVFIFEE